MRHCALLAGTWLWRVRVVWGVASRAGASLPSPLSLTLILSKSRQDPVRRGRHRSLLSAAHPGICNGMFSA